MPWVLYTFCRLYVGKLLCPGCLDSGSKLETSNQNNKEAKEIIRESVSSQTAGSCSFLLQYNNLSEVVQLFSCTNTCFPFLNLFFHLHEILGNKSNIVMVIPLTKAKDDVLIPYKVILKLGLPQRAL